MRLSRVAAAAGAVVVVVVLLAALGSSLGAFGSPSTPAPGAPTLPPAASAAASAVAGPAPASGSPAAAITLSAPGVTPAAISLAWTNPGGLFFSNYTIAYSSAGATGPFSVAGVVTSQTTLDFARGSLSPGMPYWWEVTEEVSLGTATTSNVLEVVQPTPAYLVASDVTSNSVTLSWNNNASYGGLLSFESYGILESSDGSAFSSIATITNAATLSYTDTTLVPGTGYSFFVNTTDCVGCSGAPTPSSSTASNSVTIGTVVTLSANVGVERSVIDVGQLDLLTCTASGGESPYAFAWQVNGSSYAPGTASVSLQFSSPGPKTAGCQVTDHLGDLAYQNLSITVNSAPSVDPAVNRTTADVGEPISFDCTGSGGTAPITLSWSFGDGTGQSGGVASRSYAQPGTFVAACTGTDAAGVTVSQSTTLVVSSDPLVQARVNSTAAAPGSSLTFTATASNGSGSFVSYAWQFGDTLTGSGATALHAYASAGTYTASVRVTDSNGLSAQAQVTVTVAPIAVAVVAGPTSATNGTPVTFTASASGGAGAPYNYSWAFGDGSFGYGATVHHTYTSIGTFHPTLTVTDPLHATNTTAWPAVSVTAPPAAPATPPPLAWLPLWLLVVIAAVVGALAAAIALFALRREERRRGGPLSRWVPPVGPKGAVHGVKICPKCGASNPSLRRACQTCGAPLPRTPSG